MSVGIGYGAVGLAVCVSPVRTKSAKMSQVTTRPGREFGVSGGHFCRLHHRTKNGQKRIRILFPHVFHSPATIAKELVSRSRRERKKRGEQKRKRDRRQKGCPIPRRWDYQRKGKALGKSANEPSRSGTSKSFSCYVSTEVTQEVFRRECCVFHLNVCHDAR